MRRKKELYDDFKKISKQVKDLSSIVESEGSIPSEDEIHGWAIKMNFCVDGLNKLKNDILEFYRS